MKQFDDYEVIDLAWAVGTLIAQNKRFAAERPDLAEEFLRPNPRLERLEAKLKVMIEENLK